MAYELSWQEIETGDGRFENDEFDVALTSDVTIYIKADGTDTATARYLNLERRAKTVVIRPGASISIKTINGKVLKVPITITADTTFTMSKGVMWKSCVLTTEDANTNIKILVT